MSKFNYYLEKSRNENKEGREISEEEKIKKADEILNEEDKKCCTNKDCKDDKCDGESCKETDITESLSIKTKVKMVLEEDIAPVVKAKKIRTLFTETGIEQEQIISKLSTSFAVDDITKEELLKYY